MPAPVFLSCHKSATCTQARFQTELVYRRWSSRSRWIRRNFPFVKLFEWTTTTFLLFSRAVTKYQDTLITGLWAQLDISGNSIINVRVNIIENRIFVRTLHTRSYERFFFMWQCWIVNGRLVWLAHHLFLLPTRSSSSVRWSSHSPKTTKTSSSKTSPSQA